MDRNQKNLNRKNNIEAIIDALIASKEVVDYDREKLDEVNDRIIYLQEKYKQLYGDFYRPK